MDDTTYRQLEHNVWQEMRHATRYARYYYELSNRERWKHRSTRYVLLGAMILGTVALSGHIPTPWSQFVQLAAAVLAIGTTAWDFMSSYANRAAILHSICIDCMRVEHDLDTLWTSVRAERIDFDAAESRREALAGRLLEITSQSSFAEVTEDRVLNEKCLNEADEVLEARHAIG